MNRRNVCLWFLAVAMLASQIVLIRYFIYHLSIKLAVICLCCLAISSLFYMITNKAITHPTAGYTAVHAWYFYKKCKDKGIDTTSQMIKRFDEVQKIASTYDFAKKLDKTDLIDLYKCGRKIFKGD